MFARCRRMLKVSVDRHDHTTSSVVQCAVTINHVRKAIVLHIRESTFFRKINVVFGADFCCHKFVLR